MSNTTFSTHRFVPDGRAMLACSALLPDGWVKVPLPEETMRRFAPIYRALRGRK